MLVLSRKRGESIHIGDGIVITILDVRPSRTRIGINAPQSVRVQRDQGKRHVGEGDLAETIEHDAEIVDVREDLVKTSGNSGALGGFQNRNVTVARI